MTSYLASYDISYDRARTSVARILLSYGTRLQKSVFVVWLDETDFHELQQEVGPLLAKEDAFDLIPIDLHPDRNWLRWQRSIDFVQSVRVFG